MYLPPVFSESDLSLLQQFMRRYSFATLTSHRDDFHASHLPLVLLPERGSKGTLIGHMARANPQWRDFDGECRVLCIFHGPHAYISPSWYQERPAVPTWNYAVVHASGRPRTIEAPEELAKLIDRTVEEFEPALQDPNNDGHSSFEYRAPLLNQIVGFEITIEELQGKFKLGQNRSLEDQRGVAEALRKEGAESAGLLELMNDQERRRRR